MDTWRDRAACKDAPLHIFFPEQKAGPGSLKRARAYCESCPVQEPCGQYSLINLTTKDDDCGMWAGTTHRDRRKLRREIRESTTTGVQQDAH